MHCPILPASFTEAIETGRAGMLFRNGGGHMAHLPLPFLLSHCSKEGGVVTPDPFVQLSGRGKCHRKLASQSQKGTDRRHRPTLGNRPCGYGWRADIKVFSWSPCKTGSLGRTEGLTPALASQEPATFSQAHHACQGHPKVDVALPQV